MSEVREIALARNQNGRLELVAIAGDEQSEDHLWHARQTAPNGVDWTGWQSLGTPIGGASLTYPAVGRDFRDCLEVFLVADDGTDWQVWHRRQTVPNGDDWTGWASLGSPGQRSALDPLVLAQNQDLRLELVATDGDLVIWHIRQTPPDGDWSGWDSLGEPSGEAASSTLIVGVNADGRLESFTRGLDLTIWHSYQRQPNGDDWSYWSSLGSSNGGAFGSPAVARDADGRLELFALDGTFALWHSRQQTADTTDSWTAWERMGGRSIEDDMSVGTMADRRLVLFATDDDQRLLQREQDVTGRWSPWSSFASLAPAPIAQPRLAPNTNGRLELFLLNRGTGGLRHLSQTAQGDWAARPPWPPPDSL